MTNMAFQILKYLSGIDNFMNTTWLFILDENKVKGLSHTNTKINIRSIKTV